MKYIYYTVYRHFSNVKSNDTPAFNAMVFISMLEGANVMTLLLFVPDEYKFSFQSRNQIIFYGIIIGLTIMTINYYTLIKPLPELKIKYKNESDTRKTVGTILLLSYIIGTILTTYFISVELNGF